MIIKMILALLCTAVISYLLGSCNSAIITVKLWKHEDIREKGSKNAGLTNTLRCYGKGPALITLLGDLSKGIVSVLLSILVFKLFFKESIDSRFIGYIAGFFAIIGHIFPVYYGFKGGKGILVSASILIVIDPLTFCIVIPFFALIILITRYVSVASIASAIAYPIITFSTQYFIQHLPLDRVILHTVLVIGTSLLLIYMHRANIQRLKAGTENKFGKKKQEADNNG